MNFKSLSRDDLDEKKLPDSIYTSVVRSLYADAMSLLVGILCIVVAPMVLYWKTNDPIHLLFSCLFFAIGMFRLRLARQFEAEVNETTPVSEYAVWENHYVYSSSLFVLVLGSWFFAGVARSDDPFVDLMSISLTLCYLIGIIGRNFGSDKVVGAQVGIAGMFLIAGFLMFGDVYSAILGVYLFPFFMAMRLMAKRLRNVLFEAEINALENRVTANRFDVALDNITHGVAMLESSGKIVVANDQFIRLAGFGEGDVEVIGENVSVLAKFCQADSPRNSLATQIKKCLAAKHSVKFDFEIGSGKIIEADYFTMPEGGIVLLSDISDRVASEKAIRELASYDPLTNLPNRRFFMSEIDRLLCKDGLLQPCAMFFIDLDKFKEINDTLGHAIGDKLLKTTASRLQLLLPEGGIICRFGGDEFVIIIPGMENKDVCAKFAESVLKEVKVPVSIESHELSIGASIGIALAPQDGSEADQLLQYTDAALYDAKAHGRTTYTFYSEELGETIRFRRELEVDLRQAILNNGLDVHYQPLVNLQKGRITTCEALVRWKHPVHGNISPSTFVQIAEESGLIVLLGEYVIHQAAKECASWPDDVRVAVNVSSVQFQKGDIDALVSSVLKQTGLLPHRLELEVTETTVLEDIEETTKILNRLSEIGVRISLDDFGTGFSSLAYLHSLPLDKVKIDRSFIQNNISDARSLTLLQGIVDLTKRLGLSVVLEGIETEEQMRILEDSIEVHEVQGFLFARPMPAKDVKTLLNAGDHKDIRATQQDLAC